MPDRPSPHFLLFAAVVIVLSVAGAIALMFVGA